MASIPEFDDLTPEQWRRLLAAVFGPPRLIWLLRRSGLLRARHPGGVTP